MTMLRAWRALVYLGDGAVLIPCALLLFAWLIAAPGSRRSAWWWLAALLVAGGGVALSKLLYMVSGFRPAGWNFIGLSGHATLSFLFWPVAAALVTSRSQTGLRAVMVALGACLALAISAASWVLRDHSLLEVALGAFWGALVATVFLATAWRQVVHVPSARKWMIVSMALLAALAFGHEFPSTRVLGWIALQVSEHTVIHTRDDLGPQAQLSNKKMHGADTHPPAAPSETPAQKDH